MRDESNTLIKKVIDWVEARKLLPQSGPVILAVSGGADSVFMLYIFASLLHRWRIKLRIVHINHMLRGIHSEADQIFVEKLASDLDIPIDVVRADVKERSKLAKVSIEESARLIRQEIYRHQVRKWGGVVATAHTADDVVETFLFNLFRGTGVRGLAGIPSRTPILVRPILPIWRKEIIAYLEENNISWREDITNESLDFTRNKIRHKVLPYLEEIFGSDVKTHILSASRMIEQTRNVLEDYALRKFSDVLIGQTENAILLNAKVALSDVFSFGEILRQCLPQLGVGLREFSSSRIDGVYRKLCDSTSAIKVQLWGGVFIFLVGNAMIITDREHILLERNVIPVPGEIELSGDMGTITAELVPYPSDLKNHTNLVAYLDYSGQKLEQRYWKEGLLYCPLGGVTVPVAEYIKSQCVPRILRLSAPLIFVGQRLAWIAGFPPAEYFKVHENSHEVLKLEWKGRFAELFYSAMRLAREKR